MYVLGAWSILDSKRRMNLPLRCINRNLFAIEVVQHWTEALRRSCRSW